MNYSEKSRGYQGVKGGTRGYGIHYGGMIVVRREPGCGGVRAGVDGEGRGWKRYGW